MRLIRNKTSLVMRICLVALILFSVCAAALNAGPANNIPANETPVWANDFVDTIGENTHCSFAHIGWVDCKNPNGTAAAIKTLGVRHIRDNVSDYWSGYSNSGSPHIPTYDNGGTPTPVTTFYKQLAANADVKFDFIIGLKYGNHSPYVGDILAAVPSTEAFELGGNEPDSPYSSDPCPSPNPSGLSCWPTDSVSQIQFYSSYVRAAGLKRVGPSITFGPDATCSNVPGSQRIVLTTSQCPTNGASNLSVPTNLSPYLDAANLHHYAGEMHPGNNTLARYRADAKAFTSPAATWWMTEAGYGTGKNGDTDLRIAKYEPRIFAEHYYEGVQRTYQFELSDQPKAAAGAYFDTFGLLSVNFSNFTLTPKLQYEALRSFIQILNDPGARPALVPLSYSISGGDSKLRHILMQRRDGTYQLLMWIEGPDPTPPESVKLSFCTPRLTIGSLSQFTPRNGQYVNSQLVPAVTSGCAVFGPLSVTDAMQIYRFGTSSFKPTTPLPLAGPFLVSSKGIE